MRSLDQRLLDTGLALALTAWALTEAATFSHPWRAVVLVGMTVAIARLRTAPVVVLALEVLGVALATNSLQWPQGVAVLLAAYSAAFYSDSQLLVATLLLAASAWLWAFGDTVRIPSGLVPLLLLVPVWLGGTAMRRREQRAEESAERADRLEREREATLRAERTRIARELHDVVTHSVSVMVLQTGAAREIMPKDEARSRALLQSVESGGRSALEELRHMLGLLSDQRGDTPREPQPGVSEIPSLIEQIRQAGLDVELRVEGDPRPISGGLAVTAYRIVQEALTNVIKHAAGAASEVVVRWSDAAIELEIIDQGKSLNGVAQDVSPGRGLTGMRERALMYRGALDAGPRPDGGYVVRARIPLENSRA
jgi:signal transduction histidine kinase